MNRLKVFLKDPNKKSVFRIIKEVIILTYKKREIPFYYFKYLYKKNVRDYLDHASLKEQELLKNHRELHNPKYTKIIDNKLLLAKFCQENGLSTPKIVLYNYGYELTFNGDTLTIETEKDLIKIYDMIFSEDTVEALFLRPLSSSQGNGCLKLTKQNYKQELTNHCKTIINDNYLHTEVVKQHPLINQIHKKSLNTIRLISIINQKNEIEIVFACIRFGVGDSFVDNSSSGGFFVNIDLDSGKLEKKGYFFQQYGGGEITHHPNSNFEFEDFIIPYFEEVKELVIKAVELIPDGLIGWDIGIGENGPLIIEANSKPHIQGANMAMNGILKNKSVKEIVNLLK